MSTWSSKLPLLERLRATVADTIYHEQRSGFIPQEEMIEHREVPANRDGNAAATMIEGLQRYAAHDTGCAANDMDPLDHSPCTCGLRQFYNPWNRDTRP